ELAAVGKPRLEREMQCRSTAPRRTPPIHRLHGRHDAQRSLLAVCEEHEKPDSIVYPRDATAYRESEFFQLLDGRIEQCRHFSRWGTADRVEWQEVRDRALPVVPVQEDRLDDVEHNHPPGN